MATSKRFVILSGPSCIGKGSLQRAIERFYPGKLGARPVLCTSRSARTREAHGRDYYFLPASFIKSLEGCSDFAVSPVRSDWQAIHLVQVEELFEANNLLFAEVFHTFGGTLRAKAAAKKVPVLSVFLVPAEPGTPPAEIVSIMRQKLERRGVDDQKKIDERSKDAPGEIENSRHYTHVLLNRVGEDDTDEWGEFGTRDGKAGERAVHSFDDLGPAARWLTEKFLAILNGELPEGFYQRPS